MSDIPSWAKVGAKVVAVNLSPTFDGLLASRARVADLALLTEREIYVIEAVYISPGGNVGIDLLNVSPSKILSNGRRAGYRLDRFRPLVTHTQSEDVAAIKKLVEDMPATERLDRLAELLNS